MNRYSARGYDSRARPVVGQTSVAAGVHGPETGVRRSARNTGPLVRPFSIPSLKADLTVRITGTNAPELGSGRPARLEGTGTATGT
ncbi:hypothetical protein NE236_03540 [Actinoallomurus purpureus]|uniref:hypothetical protein n=1 Tax=Actinoallomurus purpureus TaxID=478114 RepID=UPI002092A637|nr:hypothetical protein [Actinoallomurus purpureus]MCO6004042.1 hypothetical protein [Actinoallomurus purpureus]